MKSLPRSPFGMRLFYGWVVVGITVIILLLAAGVRSAPGVMLDAQLIDTAWSRALVSSAVSMGLFVFGLGAPFFGSLIALIGLLIMAVAMFLSASLSQAWELQLFWGALSRLGMALAGSVIGAAIANRWFVTQRGLITGLFGAATSVGQLIFIPLLTRLTDTCCSVCASNTGICCRRWRRRKVPVHF